MTRRNQLDLYNGTMFVQDHDLIAFADQYDVTGVRYIGNSNYIKSVLGKTESPHYNLCVYVLNSNFEFEQVIDTCNQELKSLPPNGFLYLALNKFLAIPQSGRTSIDDYDAAIHQTVSQGVRAPLFRYYSGCVDNGKRFNWAHPITRFIFINGNSN